MCLFFGVYNYKIVNKLIKIKFQSPNCYHKHSNTKELMWAPTFDVPL